MPRLKPNQVPAYRLHRQSGQAIVTLSGKDHLLGEHGSKESRERYDRLIAAWLANGRRADYRQTEGITVSRLIAEFWAHAQAYYVDPETGEPADEAMNYRAALGPLRRLYSDLPAAEFGPRALKALQQEMIRMGWSRTHINRQTGRIKMAFRWAVSEELIPAAVHQALATVPGLRAGKTQARESAPVRPVPQAFIDAVMPRVSPQVQAMVKVQLLTGMRPGELCRMRTCDITRGPTIWTYRPPRHKTAHHGHAREVWIGPQAQAILTPFLKPDLQAFLFSPAEAEADRRLRVHEACPTPRAEDVNQGKTKGKRRPGNRYTRDSYRRAIARGCDAAFPPPEHLRRRRVAAGGRKSGSTRWETRKEWKARLKDQWAELVKWREEHRWHPHQLRHNAGTFLRRQYGIEAARVILGHRSAAITEVYAEADVEKAQRIMGEVG